MTSLKGVIDPVIVHLGQSISYRYAELSQKQPEAQGAPRLPYGLMLVNSPRF